MAAAVNVHATITLDILMKETVVVYHLHKKCGNFGQIVNGKTSLPRKFPKYTERLER